jgi:dolichol-phosphate mannosyltransferase
MNERMLIIIPTYNERENLPELVHAIYAQGPFHLLIVDDNSPDGTGDLAEVLAGTYAGRLFVLHRAGKLGLGTAYLEGFRWGLDHGYDLLFEMDADFSHDPCHLPQFLAAVAGGADLVLGSRYVPGGGTRNWSPLRQLLSRGGSLYAQLILGLPIHDLTGGFKCYRRRVLESLNLQAIGSNGYSFQIEMTYRIARLGFRIVETPIVFEDRRVGQSKMHGGIVLEALPMVWRLRLGRPHARLNTPNPLAPVPAGLAYSPLRPGVEYANDPGQRAEIPVEAFAYSTEALAEEPPF